MREGAPYSPDYSPSEAVEVRIQSKMNRGSCSDWFICCGVRSLCILVFDEAVHRRHVQIQRLHVTVRLIRILRSSRLGPPGLGSWKDSFLDISSRQVRAGLISGSGTGIRSMLARLSSDRVGGIPGRTPRKSRSKGLTRGLAGGLGFGRGNGSGGFARGSAAQSNRQS
jgi:hypothetical protein